MPLVVIVDDRVTNLKILRRFAERLGEDITVRTYDDPEQALAEMIGSQPDLIVTDYVMPRMSGEEFIRQCRQQATTHDVPIIVVTAYEDTEFRYRALDTGASDFLLSPVNAREFCIRARNLLTIRAQYRALHAHATSLEGELESTQRQHAEDIAHRERLLRRIVNTVPALIRAAHVDQTPTLTNDAHRAFFGLSNDRGLDVRESLGSAYVERHHRLDHRILESGRPISDIEETVIDKSGADRVLLTSKAPLTTPNSTADQVVTVSLDITERKRQERELRESEQRFRTLVESSVLGIVISHNGRPLFANRTYANMFGYSDPAEVLALESLDVLYEPTELARIREFRDLRSRGGAAPARYEFRGRRRDGSRLWAETQVQPVVWDGQPAAQSTVADITLRKTYERELQRQIQYDELTGLPNRVLALDLPGYGLSSKEEVPATMSFFAGVLAGFMDALGVERADVAGLSMGGQIALTLALEHPGRVRSLVLASPAGIETFTDEEALAIRQLFTPQTIMAMPEVTLRQNIALNFSRYDEERHGWIFEQRQAVIARSDFAGYAHANALSVAGMLGGRVYERLGAIEAPVLVLYGRDDRLIPNRFLHAGMTIADVAEAASRAMPRAEVELVDAAGHLLPVERPDVFNQVAIRFLLRHGSAAQRREVGADAFDTGAFS